MRRRGSRLLGISVEEEQVVLQPLTFPSFLPRRLTARLHAGVYGGLFGQLRSEMEWNSCVIVQDDPHVIVQGWLEAAWGSSVRPQDTSHNTSTNRWRIRHLPIHNVFRG